MKASKKNIQNSDGPKKRKNPEPGKQKPLIVEKEHVVEDPKKGKRERILSKEVSKSKNDSNQKSVETEGTGSIGLNADS